MMKASTELDYRRRIARVIEAILLEPGAPHTLDSLAAVAHLSPYHFHRIYRALYGVWLPQNGYALDTRPALELYRSAPRAGLQRACVTDLMIPIRKD
ncbi:AraC-like DNA-binding protein [Paraburkholderia bryophila]|uniref:AraC-like DNA-binding protein n=2 Tax=Paraburkholderia bryophila TaxID=420952 RepID=A0A7Z0BAK3_9BURK|nr:GyrI-like domain-containing protein [Paraburkholderia bryophila]NYH27876.1 AraC-like DNA-binding protein [Paraburkholderia bryophila]